MRPRRNKTALEKELSDINTLLRGWYVHHRQLCADACAGPSGELVSALLDVLKTLTLKEAACLITFLNSQDWHSVDVDVREVCLFAIDGRICQLREASQLPTFDDPLDAKLNLFLVAKRILAV